MYLKCLHGLEAFAARPVAEEALVRRPPRNTRPWPLSAPTCWNRSPLPLIVPALGLRALRLEPLLLAREHDLFVRFFLLVAPSSCQSIPIFGPANPREQRRYLESFDPRQSVSGQTYSALPRNDTYA